MIIIHAMEALPRLAAAALAHAASVMPVTVITGARQTGKSTLVRDLAPAGERPYFTLDDLDVLEQASDAPDDLVARAERLTLDEVQRAPQLLLAVKRAVDRRRRAGRFLLTGSANLLLMHQVSETLAGRATYLTLWPMTRREQIGMGRGGIWQELLETSYQLVRLPAYAVNRTKRVIKTPKVYWADTGLALHLAGLGEPAGAHLENLVLNDLLAWRDVRLNRPEVLYWRTATGEEVDFVIEAGRTLLPIEVKATARPRVDDAKHLRVFREEYGRRCRPGLVLHTGDAIEWLALVALAVPWRRVL